MLLAPLRHRPFRLLFAGQVISNLGDWLDVLALLGLLAYQWRLGAPALAALTIALLLPQVAAAPVAGVLVDRWPRRRVMIACDLAQAALAASLVWAPNVVVVVGTVLAMATLSTFFSPARQAAIRLTVPDADLLQANALSRLSVNTAKVLGPAVGGAIVALAGARAAFVADALTFLTSAALLMRLRLPHEPWASAAEGGRLGARLWHDFRQGAAHILTMRLLAVAVGALMLEMLIVESNDSLSVLAFKGLGMDEARVGLAIGCSGLGNVAGALGIGQWGHRVQPLRQMGAGMLLVALVSLAIGLALMLDVKGEARWFPALVLAGVGFAAIWIAFNYILQRETPPELMGRVSATASALYTSVGLAGPPTGAFLAQRIGVGPVFAITGAALAGLSVGLFAIAGRIDGR